MKYVFNALGESIAVIAVPVSAVKALRESRNSNLKFFSTSELMCFTSLLSLLINAQLQLCFLK
ncbi:hypothetical protein DP117_19150 [Brasilonema sp. UFV-L1]|nr:hypothetical protein [Brasilonema sp. UFV-L1]